MASEERARVEISTTPRKPIAQLAQELHGLTSEQLTNFANLPFMHTKLVDSLTDLLGLSHTEPFKPANRKTQQLEEKLPNRFHPVLRRLIDPKYRRFVAALHDFSAETSFFARTPKDIDNLTTSISIGTQILQKPWTRLVAFAEKKFKDELIAAGLDIEEMKRNISRMNAFQDGAYQTSGNLYKLFLAILQSDRLTRKDRKKIVAFFS